MVDIPNSNYKKIMRIIFIIQQFKLGPKTMCNIFMGRVFVKLAANDKLAFGLSKTSTSGTILPIYSDSIYTTVTTYLLILIDFHKTI
jgi:ABC-type phosphate/phosphonate transport system substrate-binding protein